MVKIDRLIFGYRRVEISPKDVSEVSSFLIRLGIQSDVSCNGVFFVRNRDVDRLLSLLEGNYEYEISDVLGVYGFIRRIKYKPVIAVGGAMVACMLFLLSNMVWDIRVSGNENVADARIVYELSKEDFSVGKFWWACDLGKIEASLLSSVNEIGWININRRGAVAYVEVVETKGDGDKDEDVGVKYSNIVADSDCVIEEINVSQGVPVVNVGDVVKKGDLLISGIISEDGLLCRAIGSVKGRMTDKIVCETERQYEKKNYEGEKLLSVSLKIFDFSINILKIYGNLTEECDIIEEVKECSLFNSRKLPLSVTKEYTKTYRSVIMNYSDEELVEVTSRRLASAVHSRLISADLCKIRTNGCFTDTGYTMYSDVVFVAEVGREREIEVE